MIKEKLLGSIKKWDAICFVDEAPIFRSCPFCSGTCFMCWLRNHTLISVDEGICSWLWGETSDCCDEFTPESRDANMEMYLIICMLYHEYYG